MHGWINLYKPRGISSAKAVYSIKKIFRQYKVGHTGTLDLEAEGVLPIAIGEATKLTNVLIDAAKQYKFTVKFGARTDTADAAGTIIQECEYIPFEAQCHQVCSRFIGIIKQLPPSYSALKINGIRAYDLARQGKDVKLNKRNVEIYGLDCIGYDATLGQATFICECSKGTYIRTLAEDISLSLQSLGFVVELQRLKVGIFEYDTSVTLQEYQHLSEEEALAFLQSKSLKIEYVLDDIPVLEADYRQTQKIRFGQVCEFESDLNCELVWVRNGTSLVAIGSLQSNNFKSSRVFNL